MMRGWSGMRLVSVAGAPRIWGMSVCRWSGPFLWSLACLEVVVVASVVAVCALSLRCRYSQSSVLFRYRRMAALAFVVSRQFFRCANHLYRRPEANCSGQAFTERLQQLWWWLELILGHPTHHTIFSFD
ncbi:hypothetical protein GE09DRAFT_52291 [Coniochaeta sp. 2T2.1]|nr:hypothetical protein GE09DRAFT_52291 [Coniochaeta sp. 2T2.1]